MIQIIEKMVKMMVQETYGMKTPKLNDETWPKTHRSWDTNYEEKNKRFVVNEHRPRCLNNSMKRLGSSMINSAPQARALEFAVCQR